MERPDPPEMLVFPALNAARSRSSRNSRSVRRSSRLKSTRRAFLLFGSEHLPRPAAVIVALDEEVAIGSRLAFAKPDVAPKKAGQLAFTQPRPESGQDQRMMAELQPLPAGPE